MRLFWSVLLLLVFLLEPSFAALQPKNVPQTSEVAWNPRKDDHDIVMPMPCGFSLILRVIAVPGGLSNDRRFSMGVNQIDDDRQIYESSFQSYIAASFAENDLPKAWIPRLGVSNTGNFSYYFLGKYEVSRGQWDAVMQGITSGGSSGVCPKVGSAESALPVRNISWFEVQNFLKRYNTWLISHAKEALPHYKGTNNIGFFRLPTEEEWEYAARGGIAVAEEDRENNDSFVPHGEKPQDYGVFASPESAIRNEPLAIGSRKPNPLKLYDVMGNVSEMIDGFFHVTIGEIDQNNVPRRRLHGASGGLLCKGGSFRSEGIAVLPGSRDEVPLYTGSGEYRSPTLGFRLILAGLNLPNAERLAMMNEAPLQKKEEKKQKAKPQPEKENSDSVIQINRNGNPIDELERIKEATSSSAVKDNLAQFRRLLLEQKHAHERERKDSLESTLRATLYQAETIRAFAFRYLEIVHLLQDKRNHLTKDQRNKAEEILEQYMQALLTAANQYKSYLRRIADAKKSDVSQIISQLEAEYSGKGTLDRHMQENKRVIERHLQNRREGFEKLSREQILRDIIPKKHLEKMTHLGKKR